MTLPPGISQADFAATLVEMEAVVGREWLFTSDEDVALYRDAYSPYWGEEAPAASKLFEDFLPLRGVFFVRDELLRVQRLQDAEPLLDRFRARGWFGRGRRRRGGRGSRAGPGLRDGRRGR